MNPDTAQTLALQALAHLAAQEDAFAEFLAAAGTSLDEVRARAGDPDLLASVLDFVLAEDERVLGFAAAAGVAPETVLRARGALSGGEIPHWT
ncbi:DUF3572 family protein [Pseudogemmobacter blasticus]|uniref:DUF3572 domain-containing protein n=1 Tax=Fuscovulum blasticum DSM 2131 TaxID=1188250 RepID=A0A2T4J6K7_FUSBL|nr:DUF3572 family protein [Fuscovulum blasticum]PTE13536.1 DUF3572 domain-containing protein [Fuscovulum blasticum DSM 2131]